MGTTLVKSKDQKIPLKGLLQAHGVPGDWGFQVSRQSEREGGKLNQPFTPVTFTSQKIFLVLISVRGWVDPRTIVRPEGLCKWKKCKAVPLQAWTGPECSRMLRFPDFKKISILRWLGFQLYAPAAFTPRKYSWYSFLLEAESNPGT